MKIIQETLTELKQSLDNFVKEVRGNNKKKLKTKEN